MAIMTYEQLDRLVKAAEKFASAFERIADAMEASTATQARVSEHNMKIMEVAAKNLQDTPY